MERVDLWLAKRGYLRSPDGHVRFIVDLAEIAEELERSEADVFWDVADGGPLAYCYPKNRVVVLADRLMEMMPWKVRRAISHELGHIVLRTRDENQVREWQRRRYGDRVVPPNLGGCGS